MEKESVRVLGTNKSSFETFKANIIKVLFWQRKKTVFQQTYFPEFSMRRLIYKILIHNNIFIDIFQIANRITFDPCDI